MEKPAPDRSARRGCPRRRDRRLAGTSFGLTPRPGTWQPGARSHILSLQQTDALFGLAQIGGVASGHPRTDTVLDVGGLEPVGWAWSRRSRSPCDLAEPCFALASDRNDVATELLGIGSGYGGHSSSVWFSQGLGATEFLADPWLRVYSHALGYAGAVCVAPQGTLDSDHAEVSQRSLSASTSESTRGCRLRNVRSGRCRQRGASSGARVLYSCPRSTWQIGCLQRCR